MKKSMIMALALVLSLSLHMGESSADEVIKVGAGQPIPDGLLLQANISIRG